jgi:dipeptidyl aminopeptidase/acylaminoacyl peptidase
LLFSSTRRDFTADLSPDGKHVVFSSVRSGPAEIWISDVDGSNLRRLTDSGGSGPRWSPDGERIAYQSSEEGQGEISVYDLRTNTAHRLTSNPASDVRTSWSRDGRSLYFSSDRTGMPQIYRISAEGGDAVRITRHGGYYAVESPGRDALFCTLPDQSHIIRKVSLKSGEEVDAIDDAWGYSALAAAPNGIYYLSELPTQGMALRFYSFASQRSSPITTISGPAHHVLSITPDGRSIIYSQIDRQDTDLMLIEPFR